MTLSVKVRLAGVAALGALLGVAGTLVTSASAASGQQAAGKTLVVL